MLQEEFGSLKNCNCFILNFAEITFSCGTMRWTLILYFSAKLDLVLAINRKDVKVKLKLK